MSETLQPWGRVLGWSFSAAIALTGGLLVGVVGWELERVAERERARLSALSLERARYEALLTAEEAHTRVWQGEVGVGVGWEVEARRAVEEFEGALEGLRELGEGGALGWPLSLRMGAVEFVERARGCVAQGAGSEELTAALERVVGGLEGLSGGGASELRWEVSRGRILWLDAVLTGSARLACATGNLGWRERYDAHVPLLDEELARVSDVGESTAQTEAANAALIALEEEAFGRVEAGDLEGARGCVFGGPYRAHKATYREGMERLLRQLDGEVRRTLEGERARARRWAALLVAPVLVWAGLWVSFRRRGARLQAAQSALDVSLTRQSEQLEGLERERAQQSAVSALLGTLGAVEAEDVGRAFLRVAVEEVGAVVGVMWMRVEEEWCRVDGLGEGVKSAERLEGLPERVRRCGERVWLEGTVEVEVGVGLVEVRVVAEPVVAGEEVLGVLVLGVRDPLNEGALGALRGTLGSLGVALRNADQNARTRRLAEALRVSEGALRERSEDLERVNEALRVASEVKGTFIATMSHEFRTPLNAILGYADLLGVQALGEEGGRLLGRLQRSARGMLVLIDDLLSLARLEGREEHVRWGVMDVSGALADALEEAEGLVATGVEVSGEIEGGLRWVTDGVKVRRIVRNLVGNAAKFTESGAVVVRGRREGERLVVEVEDSGCGIAAEDQAKIFEAFQQVGGGERRRHGGTGLGLALCRELSVLLGGSLTVESAVGKGSRFRLELPAGSEGERPPEVPVEAPPVPVEAPPVPVEAPPVPVEAPRGVARGGAKESPLHVVVISPEGEEGEEELVVGLEVRGARVTRLRPGALEDVEGVDAVVTLVGEGSSGWWEVSEQIERHPGLSGCPLVTVVSDAAEGPQALPLRVQAQLRKPVDPERLVGVVRRCARGSRVLVVDDDASTREVARATLEREGYEVVTVEDGVEGLEALFLGGFAVVVLDVSMPGLTGFDVLEVLAADPELDVPVVLFSGVGLSAAEEARWREQLAGVVQKGGGDAWACLRRAVRSAGEGAQ